jgi:intracellular sulfur oxidation DsrE/DsrF family protein
MPRILMICLMFFFAGAFGSSNDPVSMLLELNDPPAGVLFEVAAADPEALNWAIPKIREHISTLRSRFPGIEVAVISHGHEQFSLLDENSTGYGDTHTLAKDLLATENIPVQVCGNHAGMYGHKPDAYPEYVTVVDAAPKQIKRYKDLGYVVVAISRP